MYNFEEFFIFEKLDYKKEEKTILFTDIVESSKLWSKNEKKMFESLIKQEDLIKNASEKNKGMIVKGIGDAFMIVFDDLKNAIDAAVQIQKDLKEKPIKINDTNIRLRIGMCQGKVFERNVEVQDKKVVDFYGNTVNAASRMESKVSEPDGFAFSSTIKIDETELKNLLKDFKVTIIDYKDNEDLEYKRSARLLSDVHRYITKSIDELKGIKPITVYQCTI